MIRKFSTVSIGCEVDAEAAIQTASTLAVEYDDEDDPVLCPFRGVMELIQWTVSTTWKSFRSSGMSKTPKCCSWVCFVNEI